MKIVATSDTHFPFEEDMIPSGDVFIHAGDLMYSGLPDEWYPCLDSLRNIKGFKHKIFVPGNHDYHVQNYAGIASSELRRAGVTLLTDYRPALELDGVKYLGIPFVTGLPGWAFNRDEEWLENWLHEVSEHFKPDVVISHSPMFGTLDAIHPDKQGYARTYCGSIAMNRWFMREDIKPKVWISGHIHESYGATNFHGTEFRNVAMCDRNYDQVNKPHVLEI